MPILHDIRTSPDPKFVQDQDGKKKKIWNSWPRNGDGKLETVKRVKSREKKANQRTDSGGERCCQRSECERVRYY